MPRTFCSNPSRCFSLLDSVVSSDANSNQGCAEHIGGSARSLWVLCNFLLAGTLSVTSDFSDLPRLSALSLPLQEFIGCLLVCFSLHHSLDVPKAINQGNRMSHLICFLSQGSLLSTAQWPVSYTVLLYFFPPDF